MSEDSHPHFSEAAGALEHLQHSLGELCLPYRLRGSAQATDRARLVRDQLGDYVLPRLTSLDAPLLAVVGGSTGAGKSTLVSSLVRRHVATSSAIRPTTRRPLLLHAPVDRPWFDGDRVLGSLARVRVAEGDPPTPPSSVTPREVELRESSTLPEGLALLDAPDVDSVVSENRDLAATLLASADLWLFVTTAARYADAVPWEHLREAAARDAVVAIILDRVPGGAENEVEADLRRRLTQTGLDDAPVFTLPETALDNSGFLPTELLAPLRSWLGNLVADRNARAQVARRTLRGVLGATLADLQHLLAAVQAQSTEAEHLTQIARAAYSEALERLEAATADGLMLRGEVLARWQELVGTGELLRSLEAQVGRLRDRVVAALRGKPAPAARVEEAIESSLTALIVAESQQAELETEQAWRRADSAPQMLERALDARAHSGARTARAAELVRQWQGDVLALVRAEGADKRLTARLLSLGVNGVGVALMIVVFAHTGGLTGGEVGIAGGTALLAQRVLEAVFGDQAMRTMSERARRSLRTRAKDLLDEDLAIFLTALEEPRPSPESLEQEISRLRTALRPVLEDQEATR